MYMYLNEIAERLGVTTHTLRTYLERVEFAPCRTSKLSLYNMEVEHLEILRQLIYNRRGRKKNAILQDEE